MPILQEKGALGAGLKRGLCRHSYLFGRMAPGLEPSVHSAAAVPQYTPRFSRPAPPRVLSQVQWPILHDPCQMYSCALDPDPPFASGRV